MSITENTFKAILNDRYATGEDILKGALHVLELEAQVGALTRESLISPMTDEAGVLLSSQARTTAISTEEVKGATKKIKEARKAHKDALEAFDRKYGTPEEVIKTFS